MIRARDGYLMLMVRLNRCSAINFGAQFHCTVADRFSGNREFGGVQPGEKDRVTRCKLQCVVPPSSCQLLSNGQLFLLLGQRRLHIESEALHVEIPFS